MIIQFWKTGENPITCYKSKPFIHKGLIVPVKTIVKKESTVKQPVMIESPNGDKEEYKSVVEAADAVGMNCNTLYAVLNGRAKNTSKYKIYKSQINN